MSKSEFGSLYIPPSLQNTGMDKILLRLCEDHNIDISNPNFESVDAWDKSQLLFPPAYLDVDSMLRLLSNYFPECLTDKFSTALEIAEYSHEGQVRLTHNADYFSGHIAPTLVTLAFMRSKEKLPLDDTLACVALLHDSKEDGEGKIALWETDMGESPTGLRCIETELGSDVAEGVDILTKVSSAEYLSESAEHMNPKVFSYYLDLDDEVKKTFRRAMYVTGMLSHPEIMQIKACDFFSNLSDDFYRTPTDALSYLNRRDYYNIIFDQLPKTFQMMYKFMIWSLKEHHGL